MFWCCVNSAAHCRIRELNLTIGTVREEPRVKFGNYRVEAIGTFYLAIFNKAVFTPRESWWIKGHDLCYG